MYIFGTSLIVGAIAASVVSALLFLLVVLGRPAALPWARRAVYSTLGLAGGAAALLLILFVTERYDIKYVYEYSSQALEFRFRVAALWAGQPGSLVVWALVGLIAAPTLMRRTHAFEPYALGLLMAIQAMLLVFVLIRNPFVPTVSAEGVPIFPPDGRGLNPQLHNLWMVIHPPTLFASYGLLGISFVLALAGLLRRDYDGWVRLAMPWALAGWGVLALALTMGGYWAYESLGWGGYWAWDPVESSSLVPWLTVTALIHGLVLQKAHGGLRRTNFFLAILTYLLVIYASFLTRSGVLANFSVHSFVEEGLKYVLLGLLLVLLLLSVVLLVLRWRDIPRRPLSEALFSRDTTFVLGIMAFVTIAVLVDVGTSMPWISSYPSLGYALQRFFGQAFTIDDGTALGMTQVPFTDGRFSFTGDFFRRTTPPLAVILVLLMSVGPLFGWRDTERGKLMRTIRWPGIVALLVTAGVVALGVRGPMALAYVLLGTFAIGTNAIIIARTLRSGYLRIGGYLAHVGMGLLLLGVVGSYAYSSEDLRMTLAQGQPQNAFGHAFTFEGEERLPNGKTALRIEVNRDQPGYFVAHPEIFWEPRMQTWVQTPAIDRSPWQDLYISPANVLPADDPNDATLAKQQQALIGPYQLQFNGFAVEDHMENTNVAHVGATLIVTDTRTSVVRTLVPQMRLEPGKLPESLPLEMGEGKQLVLSSLHPQEQQVEIRIEGLNLPLEPAKAVIEVSTKPAIALVWTGSLLMFLGGLLAWLRRRQELRQPRVSMQPSWRGRLGGALAGIRGLTYR